LEPFKGKPESGTEGGDVNLANAETSVDTTTLS
jgi:hypothetical protein